MDVNQVQTDQTIYTGISSDPWTAEPFYYSYQWAILIWKQSVKQTRHSPSPTQSWALLPFAFPASSPCHFWDLNKRFSTCLRCLRNQQTKICAFRSSYLLHVNPLIQTFHHHTCKVQGLCAAPCQRIYPIFLSGFCMSMPRGREQINLQGERGSLYPELVVKSQKNSLILHLKCHTSLRRKYHS